MTDIARHRETETDRQTDEQTKTQRRKCREKGRERERDRQTDRQTEIYIERERCLNNVNIFFFFFFFRNWVVQYNDSVLYSRSTSTFHRQLLMQS